MVQKDGFSTTKNKNCNRFLNKVLRNTLVPTIEDGIWWIKHNEEIHQQCKDPDLA